MFGKKFKGGLGGEPEWIVAGLGNPGAQYKSTRHNAGFMVIDTIAKKENVKMNNLTCDAICGNCELGGVNCLLVKPQTFMNNSGIAIKKLAKKYNIKPENILVISDDVSFDVGKIRIRRSGSSGGQKGLGSIITQLATEEFPRIKIGVGKKPVDVDMVDWVLGNFDYNDRDKLNATLDKAALAVTTVVSDGIEAAMQKVN